MADLIITDPRLIEEILGGTREISCGYNSVLSEEDGKYYQREIRGNHVAVVDAGRAGPRVCIKDADYKGGKHFMNRKNKVFAKLMARMAKDGDTEALEEVIAEIMGEEPETAAAEPAADPAAPVVVETPVEQPVIIDCGPEILDALRRIIELLGGNAADCGNTEKQTDEDPDAIESSVGVAAAEAAEAVAETVEATAEAVAQTVAEAMRMGPVSEDPLTDDDPIEELIQEILEGTAEPEEAGTEEILSTILEPEDETDEDPEEKYNEQAADTLRAALTVFKPQIMKMSTKDRVALHAQVAEKMKGLTRKNRDRNSYDALINMAVLDWDGKALGEKIMKERNANRRL